MFTEIIEAPLNCGSRYLWSELSFPQRWLFHGLAQASPPLPHIHKINRHFILVHLERVNNLLPQYLKTFFQYEFLFALKYLSLFFASKHLETCESLSNLTEKSQWIKNNVFYQVTRVCLLSFVSVKKTKKENQKITNNFSIETN